MSRGHSFALTLLALGLQVAFAGPRVVFDASMADHGDIVAATVLHALADAGECEILAMGMTVHNDSGAKKLEALNSQYGRAKIPIGRKSGEAVSLYRAVLASAPNGSVVFCCVGEVENFRRLLKSVPDRHSSLDGRTLIEKKCSCLLLRADEAYSDADLAETWPTPIIYLDRNYGAELAVLAAVRVSCCVDRKKKMRFMDREFGAYHLDTKNRRSWRPDAEGRHVRLKALTGRPSGNRSLSVLKRIAEELVARVPKCRRTDEASATFRRSKVEKTPTGVRLLRDGKVLWNFEIDTPEGRPFFHPLNLPSGRALTDLRPKDHVWHLGYWFSWKYLNGVNYWEPADAARRVYEPAGRTRVTKKNVRVNGVDCIVELSLEYAPRASQQAVLAENRLVRIDPPDAKGGYLITTRHDFTALADVTLDRTPPHGSPTAGSWGGGYAGETLRLDSKIAALLNVRGFQGGATPAEVTGCETKLLDLIDPASGEGVTFMQVAAPKTAKFYVWPDKRMVNASALYDGPHTLKRGETLTLEYRLHVHADRAVKGSMVQRPEEKLDRGLAAVLTDRGTHVSWRLLKTDTPNRAFDLWREAGGTVEKLNAAPIEQTTDFWIEGYTNALARYSVDGVHFVPIAFAPNRRAESNRTIRLANTNDIPGQVGLGDLDGDGQYDFVVKLPEGGTDPWDLVYRPAKATCRLEAYRSDGTFLWQRDYGWNIELGTWYSPYFVADMDGDGKAEVVTKLAPTDVDYRDEDGRVQRGPEWLAVLNGLTGALIAKTSWPPRGSPDPAGEYNSYASRNQIACGYLDGKTPCVIVERGTYAHMIVEAYCLRAGRLERLWQFDNAFLPRRYYGQGDHACLCADVDGDGCDEVLIGSLVLDHDGTVLWCNERGHSDAHYLGDIDPQRSGPELFFVYESQQRQGGGLLLCDPATGGEIWALSEPTHHVHGSGMCADIDPAHIGLELYGQECDTSVVSTRERSHASSDNRWFFAANGTLLFAHTNCTFRYAHGRPVLWWDGDLQREFLFGGIANHRSVPCGKGFGNVRQIADIVGDWREEVISAEPGLLRIYATDIPAMDRRVTLMQDKLYRARILQETSGYSQRPVLSQVPSAVAPNLSLRLTPSWHEMVLDVTAPLHASLSGTLRLTKLPAQWRVDLPPTPIDLPAGGHWTKTLSIHRPPNPRGRHDFTLELVRTNAPPLILHQPAFN